MKITLVITVLTIFWINSSFAEIANDHNMKIESAYQIIKITDSKSTNLPQQWNNDKYLINLKSIKRLIDDQPSAALKIYFNKLTLNGEKSLMLENGLPERNWVYYQSSWTRKDNLIRIVDFKSLGTESDINEFLGPLASIPTMNYGVATYAINFEGETLSVTGPAIKKIWSFKRTYWSNAQIFLPIEKSSDAKIALIQIGLPVGLMNDFNYHGIYAVIPR